MQNNRTINRSNGDAHICEASFCVYGVIEVSSFYYEYTTALTIESFVDTIICSH